MSSVTNNNIAPGETVGVDWDSLRRRAKERLAPGFSYAGDVTPGAGQTVSVELDLVLANANGVDDAELADLNEVFSDAVATAATATTGVSWDGTTLTFDDTTTHVLIATGAEPPAGAELVAEFSQGSLWRLAA